MATSEVAQCLRATLSPDTNTRVAAELSLSELFTRSGALYRLVQKIMSS